MGRRRRSGGGGYGTGAGGRTTDRVEERSEDGDVLGPVDEDRAGLPDRPVAWPGHLARATGRATGRQRVRGAVVPFLSERVDRCPLTMYGSIKVWVVCAKVSPSNRMLETGLRCEPSKEISSRTAGAVRTLGGEPSVM